LESEPAIERTSQRPLRGKRPLQVATGLLGAIPVLTGLIGMFGLSDPLYVAAGISANALLDSNLRFFSGVWLGLGIAIYWLIPRIESQTVLFRVVWGMIFLGGIGRVLSMVFLALPPIPFIGFTVLELIGAPVFIAWQARVAGRVGAVRSAPSG
jgi:Domain of unknown function (DUF4345)